MRRQRLLLGLLLALGCAGIKPSAEMTEFAQDTETRDGKEVKLRFPELVAKAEAWDAKARMAQEDKDEELMKLYSHIAMLWWESAKLRSNAVDLDAERQQLAKDTAQIENELAEVQKREKLAKATLDRMKQIIALEGTMADNAEVATARGHITSAIEAIKAAQGVDADVHAKVTFAAAEAKLKAATSALGKNKPNDAVSLAIEAKASAEAAYSEAEAKFMSTSADQAKLNRQKALFDALAAVSGAERSMVEGGGVMITIVEAFSSTGVTIDPSRVAAFDTIAQTAKNYGEYSLVIEGHTDSRGSKAKNLQLSESRAQSVLAYLAQKGVSPSRMNAMGKGSNEPVAENSTKEGRSKNRRIEILFAAGG